ncbi:MAG: zinc-dependent dehydrogenase [Candidatus Omnitrophica bacterium]|nr:zinc-dependent dehydrogenase [Candidatus Omnitrophota bacterium]
MRVARYYNNKDVRIEEMPVPKINPQELLVKVMASGICGSDVMEWYRIKKAPLVLGHEIGGEIVEVGREVSKYKVGQRVFVAHHVPCNTCRYCLQGNHTACETLHTTNFYPGGFAEYLRVPPLNVDRGVFVLPETISYEESTFIEPLACVVRGQRMVNLKAGQNILILGAGISGLLHLLLARFQGAGKIAITDINAARLKLASSLGADLTINAQDDVVSIFRKANDNRLADLVVVCASALPAFQQALQAVDRGGTILCFAPTQPGIDVPVPVTDFWRNAISIMHSYGSSPFDTSVAVDILRTNRLAVKELVTHRLGLAEAGKGFALVAEAKECVKVILFPHQQTQGDTR